MRSPLVRGTSLYCSSGKSSNLRMQKTRVTNSHQVHSFRSLMALPLRDGQTHASAAKQSLTALFTVALWFGIVTGLVEGAGLLLFQHINWARWGPMMHVSEEIVWISPLVDLCFFLLLAVLVGLLAKIVSRFPAVRVLVFLLTFLCVYDWLTLNNRLLHRACLLLAVGVAFAFSRWFGQHQDSAHDFWKRTLPWAVAAFVLALVGIQGGKWLRERHAVAGLPSPAPGSPNVLVIVVDTLRADHVSAYGYARPTTPTLDHLAQQGVLFENAISPSSWSLPSHVSLVTGRYVYEHGIGNVQPSPWGGWGSAGLGGFPTLGEALQQKGYRSGAFSANRTYFSHDLGFGRGFVHFEDYFHSPADMFVRTLYGREFSRTYLIRSDKSLVKRMLRGVGFTSLLEQDAEGSGSYGGAFGVRKRADAINDEVLRWVDRDRQRPFFAFLNYFDVHDPYGAPRSYSKPEWQQQDSVDEYDDGVKYDDDFIGRLMHSLEQRGLAANTLVIITSDHGESLGQHSLATHGRALYWELIHVPLVIWYPGHVPAGIRVSRPVTNAAIPETVMDLLGTKGGFPGPALSALWKTPAAETNWPDPLSELVQNRYPGKKDLAADALEPTASTGAMRSLITPQWQLIVHEKLGIQLYDWTRDPGESNNLTNTPEGNATALGLSQQLEQMRRVPPP
jgi:arylsulfatase A-like enzyme